MLKRIDVQHLVLGMYLHELCGSWMEHPFWRTRFLLTDPEDLVRIRATQIHEVWIDTSKGLDVPDGTASTTRAEADAQVDATLEQADSPQEPAPEAARGARPPASSPASPPVRSSACCWPGSIRRSARAPRRSPSRSASSGSTRCR